MKRVSLITFLIAFQLLFVSVTAQDMEEIDLKQNLGSVEAIMYAGVSYDVLRDPTNVSFDYPEGYLSFNIPIMLTVPDIGWNEKLGLEDSTTFVPRLGAQQRLNYSFRINIPMLKGVFTYAYSHNVSLAYSIILGNSSILMEGAELNADPKVSATMRGFINVPVQYTMGWQTQSFGYAFRPLKGLTIGIHLNQHIFEMKGSGNISANMIGNINVDAGQINKNIKIDYGDKHIFGSMNGDYQGSRITPSFGIKWWRLGYTGRMGINKLVPGFFKAKYALPFFVNPQTFEIDSLTNAFKQDDSTTTSDFLNNAMKFASDVEASKTDSVVYSTTTPLEFNVPSGHTLTFDLIRDRLSVSYTKVVGNKSNEISGYHEYEGHWVTEMVEDTAGIALKNSQGDDSTVTRLKGAGLNDLDFGFAVDNVILLAARFKHFRFNLGTFTMDFRERHNDNLIGGIKGLPHMAGDAIFPILSLSTLMGSTTKFLFELDLLPIPSIKTGLNYYF
ncbi:MAG: hypothetical protein ABIA63_10980 [bacterium]